MKKFLVTTLILTIIFPGYCFAVQQRVIPAEYEILERIVLIIEDGIVEEKEVKEFVELLEVEVTPLQSCLMDLIYFVLSFTAFIYSLLNGPILTVLISAISSFYWGFWLLYGVFTGLCNW